MKKKKYVPPRFFTQLCIDFKSRSNDKHHQQSLPLAPEPLQFEVELSGFPEPDASMLTSMLAFHGQHIERCEGCIRMKCSTRALHLLLQLQEEGALPCNMVYRKSRSYVTT